MKHTLCGSYAITGVHMLRYICAGALGLMLGAPAATHSRPRWRARARTLLTAADMKRAPEIIDAKVAASAAEMGVGCPPGCGACCTAPHVKSSEAECVPLAEALVRNGRAVETLERLDAAHAAGDSTCVIYQPSNADGSRGRCGEYELRPGSRRLFGFAGRISAAGADLHICTATVFQKRGWGGARRRPAALSPLGARVPHTRPSYPTPLF